MIRKAEPRDASRIAEILVFSKRTNYRRIFHDDAYSFGVLQVLPIAQEYRDDPHRLEGVYVFEDDFVKGMIHIKDDEVCELYTDPFFTGQGIGAGLLEWACSRMDSPWLWVLEENTDAIRFYEAHGFHRTDIRIPEADTTVYKMKMQRN